MIDLDESVKVLNIASNVRARAFLTFKYNGIKTLRDLLRMTEKELLRLPNVGRSTVIGIENALDEVGLCLSDDSRRTQQACISMYIRGMQDVYKAVLDSYEKYSIETIISEIIPKFIEDMKQELTTAKNELDS